MRKWYVICGILALLWLVTLGFCLTNFAGRLEADKELAEVKVELADVEKELADARAQLELLRGEGYASSKGLSFLEHDLIKEWGCPAVIGRVQNTSPRVLSGVKVTVKWYDSAGNVLGESRDYLDGELMPGEVFRFKVLAWQYDFEDIARYQIRAVGTKA